MFAQTSEIVGKKGDRGWGGAMPSPLHDRDARATLAHRVRALLVTEPVLDGTERESLLSAAYEIGIALEWMEVRIDRHGIGEPEEAELIALSLELSVLEHEWFCGDRLESTPVAG